MKTELLSTTYIEPNTIAKIVFDTDTKMTSVTFREIHLQFPINLIQSISFDLFKKIYSGRWKKVNEYYICRKMYEEITVRAVTRWIDS